MEKFNLEKALAGNPVKLRNGKKAFVKYRMSKEIKYRFLITANQIAGFVIDNEGFFEYFVSWNNEGKYKVDNMENDLDIIGMWGEPRPRVQLDLPAPLKKAADEQFVYRINNGLIYKHIFQKESSELSAWLESGQLFSSCEDAEEWLDAMQNSRR